MESKMNMRNMIKKTVSLILVIALLAAILPNLSLPAIAAETTTRGSTAFEQEKKIYAEYPLNGGIDDLLFRPLDDNTSLSISSARYADKNNDESIDIVFVPRKEFGPCDGSFTCPGRMFVDMPAAGTWAHDPIDWAVVKGVTNGTDATHFSPNSTCTRAQVVTFLWRANGCPEPQGKGTPFTDVKPDAYFYKAVLWAVENGITTGTSSTTFSPNSGCTRGQVATFLYRFYDEPERKNSANPFRDIISGQYYYEPVLWALETGVTTGTSETKFSPDNTCTRAQIVTFLYRSAAPRSADEQAIRTDVRSFSVDDVVLFQNDDMITIDGVQRYDYESYAKLHLTFSDGTGADATPWALRGGAGMALTFDDDQNSKAWGLGKHRVTATLNGLQCSFNVEVVQTPVKSAVISPMTVYEAVDGYFIDDEFYYDLNPRDIKVTFKDGTVCENEMELDEYVMQKYHRNYYVFGSYFDNQIQAGRTIQATATILGLDVNYTVTAKKNPIQSVSIGNLSILEGTNGWWDRTYTVYGWQFNYYLEQAVLQKMNVRQSDATFNPQEHLNGIDITMSDGEPIYANQMAHPWRAGKTYSLLLHFAGKTCPFQVTIQKSPIRSVSVAPLKLLQGENQYESYDINDFGNEEKYMEYGVWPNECSVQLSDGSMISGSRYEVFRKLEEKYTGMYDGMINEPQTVSDQRANHQWGIGEHVAFTGILGVLAPGSVTITPNPISSVTAIPVTVKAFTHGGPGFVWDETVGAWQEDSSWYEYNLFDIVQVRVVYKDGTVKTGLLSEFSFDSNDGPISCYDPQSKDTPWGIGKHTVEVDFVGFHVTAEITIVS